MISIEFNNTICERDMDLLFIESVITDPEFCSLLISKTDLKGKPFRILSTELSKSDADLGESDITVVMEIEGRRYGFLIEDKIDAVAMPQQHDRYVKRGEKGVQSGEYHDFKVFIFCPDKYWNNNEEARRYEHLLSYEECREYFSGKDDPLSRYRFRQLQLAISKAKKPPVNNVNEKANTFLKQYIGYQREYYPTLNLITKDDKNGWWTEFRTELGSVYIDHKIQEGFVDLTIPGAADKYDRVQIIADWARKHKIHISDTRKTKKSSIIRIHVPKLEIEKGFESVVTDELNQCFDAVKEFTDLANIINMANSLIL